MPSTCELYNPGESGANDENIIIEKFGDWQKFGINKLE